MSNEEFESFEPDLISLLDEDGNEYEFEILDEIDFKDSHFYALMPLFDLPEQDIESENTYMKLLRTKKVSLSLLRLRTMLLLMSLLKSLKAVLMKLMTKILKVTTNNFIFSKHNIYSRRF